MNNSEEGVICEVAPPKLRTPRLLRAVDPIAGVLIAFVSLSLFVRAQDPIAVVGLAVSMTVAYVAAFRPSLRRPLLHLSPDKPRCSPATDPNDTSSWFIRLCVTNVGLTAARETVGRLKGVWTSEGTRLRKFDPLTLYWARQDNKHTGFSPVQIRGQGDIEYLDIAQVKDTGDTPLSLRVVLPPPMTLAKGEEGSPSPSTDPALKPGTYYLQVGLYSENADPVTCCLEVRCSDTITGCHEEAPCRVSIKKPPFA